MTANNVTLSHNRAVGGAGNTAGFFAGDGAGGGLMNVSGTATVSNSTIADNQVLGGPGGDGGNGRDALGGSLANLLGVTLTVSGSTLAGNRAGGGDGDVGGNAFGGGICNDGPSTVPSNLARIIHGPNNC